MRKLTLKQAQAGPILTTLAVGVLGGVLGTARPAAAQTAAFSATPAERVTQPLAEPEFQPLPNTTPLAITVTPAPVPKGQMPEFVTMTLTNTSDHEVRLPEPGIGCTDAANGTIELVVSPTAEVAACVTPAEAVVSPEKWTTLQPGETANFGQRVTPLLAKGVATFEVRATYTPPIVTPAEQEQLYRDSVTYPTEALHSAPVTLIREQ